MKGSLTIFYLHYVLLCKIQYPDPHLTLSQKQTSMNAYNCKSYAHFPGCLKTDLFKISNEGLHHIISNRNGWWMGAAAMEKKRSTIAFIARSVDIHNWPIIIHNMRIIVCPSIDIVALPFSARNNTFL